SPISSRRWRRRDTEGAARRHRSCWSSGVSHRLAPNDDSREVIGEPSMKFARLAFVAALTLSFIMSTASAQKTQVVMGTATPGGGFPLFGGAGGEAHDATGPTL